MRSRPGRILIAALLLWTAAGCGAPTPPASSGATAVATPSPASGVVAETPSAMPTVAPVEETATPPGEVAVGEMPDGFVKMPGEPSREDPRYVITEDVCGQFTARFVAGLLGRPVDRVESSANDDSYTCTYYLEPAGEDGPGPYVSLTLRYASVENQKKGHAALGRTIRSEARIPMENAVILQDDGLINEVYLALSPNKYLSVNRSSGRNIDEGEMQDFCIALGTKIADMQ